MFGNSPGEGDRQPLHGLFPMAPDATPGGIVDAPDDVTMNAVLYSLASLGNVRTETLRAFTRQETDATLSKMA